MGRKRWTNRLTVEQCPIRLSAPDLRRLGVFRMSCGSGELTWRSGNNGPTLATLDYEIKADVNGARGVYFRPQILSHRPLWIVARHSIGLLNSRPHFGGARFWFECDCGRRVGRLYLPPGAREFHCRTCYNLTYRSTQEHDQRVYDMARSLENIQAGFRAPRMKRRLLACGAFRLWYAQQRKKWRSEPPSPISI